MPQSTHFARSPTMPLRTHAIIVVLGAFAAVAFAAPLPAAEPAIDFVAQVQPIFRAHCYDCHAAGNEEGGLNLAIKAKAIKGGDGGAVIVAGDSGASRLVRLVSGREKKLRMPPEGNKALTIEQIETLRDWVDQGAPWPDGADVTDPKLDRARNHWAFQPLGEVPVPTPKHAAWARTPVDRFLLARMEEAGLAPAPPASRRVLLRRLTFDLHGLPPSPEALAAFEDSSEQGKAYEELVTAHLGSVHYGERWGRHWLDVARYADSSGQEGDQDRPLAYRYRDFVIRALTDDMPFDQFLRWQIAGDEIAPDNPEAALATGFLTAGPNTVLENTFLEEERLRNRYNELDDMLGTLGTAMLGLTIGCARCHDHKFDAISAREYYGMLAALHSGDRKEVKLGNPGTEALVFRDFGAEARPSYVFPRGDFRVKDQPISLGFVEVLTRGKSAAAYWEEARQAAPKIASTNQRHALALWLTDVERGAGALVARVIVNRVWQHHFGAGLSRTPGDFGVRGEAPTHRELLDWLASDFVRHGWRLKRLHRLIVTSAAYQQSGRQQPAQTALDPDNKLLARMRPRRIEAEALRDAMLAVSGSLQVEPFGPAFKAPIPREANVARNLKSPYPDNIQDGPENHRRSVYMFHKRIVPFPLLQAFDRPEAQQSCSRRDSTTVAPQALALLNDPFVRARALDFADRLIRECGEDDRNAVSRGFTLALAREPAASESAACVAFIQAQRKARGEREGKSSAAEIRRLALADFGQTLFGLNEFIYVD